MCNASAVQIEREVKDIATMDKFTALPSLSRSTGGRRISDRVYHELALAIRNVQLAPGELLSESDLARQLNVSRTPVREAIARLADAGLVNVVPQVGTSVARIRIGDVTQACFVREALEVGAFERATRDEDLDVSVLRQVLQRQDAALIAGDGDGFFTTDEDLHAEIFRLGGVPSAWDVVRRSKLQLDRFRRLNLREAIGSRLLFEEHVRIVDLLESRNVLEGRMVLVRHANRLLDNASDTLERFPEYFAHDE